MSESNGPGTLGTTSPLVADLLDACVCEISPTGHENPDKLCLTCRAANRIEELEGWHAYNANQSRKRGDKLRRIGSILEES